MLKKLRNYFLAGLVIFIPLAATLWVMKVTFNFLDGILKPVIGPIINVPGISFLILVILIILIGMVGTMAVGKRAMGDMERGILNLPFDIHMFNVN